MNADRFRRLATIVSFAATMTLNSLANILPINGQTTAEISDRFQVLVVPAGYVFSIWGLIYLGQAAFTLYQALPSRAADPLLRRLGLLPAAAGLLNAGWILAWQYEVFPVTIVLMLGLLATLAAIRIRIHEAGDAPSGAARWAVRLPFSVYLGWISVATIANVTVALAWAGFSGLGLAPEAWAAAVLAVGAAIGAIAVLRARDTAIGLVVAWAYAGVVAKESAVPAVALVAAAGAVLQLVLVAVVTLDRRRPAGRDRPATPSLSRPRPA